jgi:hypothetical protein
MQASGLATAIDVAAGIVYITLIKSLHPAQPTHLPRIGEWQAEAICLDSKSSNKLYVSSTSLVMV